MNDVPLVKAAEASRDLLNDVTGLVLGEGRVGLLHDVVHETATVHAASHNIEVVGVLERLDEGENVGAARDFLHQLDLEEIFLVLFENVSDLFFRNYFYCDSHLRVQVLGEVYLPERSFAEDSLELVLLEAVLFTALGSEDLTAPVLQIVIAVKVDLALVRGCDHEEEAVRVHSIILRALLNDAKELVHGVGQALRLGALLSVELDCAVSDAEMILFVVAAFGSEPALVGYRFRI